METVCIFKCAQCLQEILVRGTSTPQSCLHPHLSLISFLAQLRRFSQPQGTCNSTKRTKYDPQNKKLMSHHSQQKGRMRELPADTLTSNANLDPTA